MDSSLAKGEIENIQAGQQGEVVGVTLGREKRDLSTNRGES